MDISLLKDFQFTERLRLEFRAEAYNVFNQAHLGFPVLAIGNPNVGQIGSAGDGRDIQFGLKLSF